MHDDIEDELTPEQKFAAEDPETMVPRALSAGRSPDDIVLDLRRLGYSEAAAKRLIARVADDLRRFRESPQAREQLVSEARRQFFGGLLHALIGVLGSIVTLIGALAGAISFVVAFIGLFFGGLILAGRGWARWRLYGKSHLTDQPGSTKRKMGP
jgi:hypothetical protein